MSSVAMALNNGMNPGQLNQWLINHGGYADGDLIIWASVNALGSMTFYNRYVGAGSLDLSDLAHYVAEGHPVILNVRGGSHWVLATHVSGSTVSVNDPGFNQNSYEYSEASNFVVYSK
jgi:phage-related tail fiber protein